MLYDRVMAPLAALLGLGSYLLQQAGIIFGVGAETVLLSVYLAHGAKAGKWRHETQLYMVQRAGLGLVVLSGLGAVILHAWLGQEEILLAPAFLLKWLVIVVLIGLYVLERRTEEPYAQALVRGAAGAQWYALLILHGLAPATAWPYLLLLYAGWLGVFMVGWAGFLYLVSPVPKQAPQKLSPKEDVSKQVKTNIAQADGPSIAIFQQENMRVRRDFVLSSPPPPPKTAAAPAPLPPKPAPAPAAPRSTAPLPVAYHQELAAPHTVPAPAPTPPKAAPAPVPPHAAPAPKPPHAAPVPVPPPAAPRPAPVPKPPQTEAIPAIRVMPRSPEELGDAARGAVVQFN